MKRNIAIGISLVCIVVIAGFLAMNGRPASKDTYKIGIVQIVDHTSLNTIRTTFIDQLKELGYEDGKEISIDYQNAQNDQSLLKTICQKFVSNKYDLIVAIATPSAQAAISETDDIPVLFTACTDPISSGLVDSLEKPGKNATGTSDYVPLTKSVELADRITPGITRIGTIYNPGETVSTVMIEELKEYTSKNNMELYEATITSTADTQQAVESIIDKVDAIFLTTDNTVASSMNLIANIAGKKKIPVYAGADSMVQDGALAGCGVDYEQLAIQTAQMAVEIIQGKEPAEMPVQRLEESFIFLNTSTAKQIDVTFPDDVISDATNIFE
ncbi:ABC transporter substrate-binding protein [Anaeromicropila populeti]|uniref:Putative ABC transport system substrate-binding protein n=1 Tax=Anaeromicropila populeti TaxID=37658 RepID=A0A1I6IN27_9FIRM|nr:ABC transporter substrate-binding protein [Anaeromicropila populeti]SFR67690.1 putative ABC transport system substrate-binding protein [Anaeromicropila populeti]